MKEIIHAAIAIEVQKKKSTEEEGKLTNALVKSTSTVTELIPDDISVEDFNKKLGAVCKGIVRAQLFSEGLLSFLGRLLAVAAERKDLWEKFEKFEDFVAWIRDTYGVSRATVFECKRLSLRWSGTLNAQDFEAVGRVKLNLIGKVVDKGSEGTQKAVKLIEMAKTSTAKELSAHLESKGLLPASEASGGYFRYPGNKRQIKEHTKFFNDARIHAVVGSSQVADIIDALLAEASIEWLHRGEELMAEQAAATNKEAAAGA
jgi:hypothetical protein